MKAPEVAARAGGGKEIIQSLSKVIQINEGSLKIPQAEISVSWMF